MAIRRLHDSVNFVRLHVTGTEELIVEFAIDSADGRPPVISIVGPTFDPEELAGRKLVALFRRAEARDFADVYVLAQRFDRTTLLQRAHEVPIGSADVTACAPSSPTGHESWRRTHETSCSSSNGPPRWDVNT